MKNISFIVPVYNVEPYLRKCLDSLLAQDYTDYEIILVDDGSSDSCALICDDYAAKYKKIRVIHQMNGGLSAARNSGINVATGEYVCFVDSDDYWEPNVLSGLMAQIERDNLDVLRFKYQHVNDKYEVFNPHKRDHRLENDYSESITDGPSFLNARLNTQCYAVMYIIKRGLLMDNACFFTEGVHFEDVDWLPRMMLKAKRVASTERVVYNYLIRQGSITQETNDIDKRRRNVQDTFYIIERYNKLIEEYPKCHWLREMRSSMAFAILNTVTRFMYDQRRKYIHELRILNAFPLTMKCHSVSLRIKILLCNISPLLLTYILHIQNNK